ncbi:MAG: hypothetical protein QMD03_07935 [Syntrophales bacterium]|nr:hypothetical protein [Syntrophales bacterium]
MRYKIDEFSEIHAWLFDISEEIIAEAVRRGRDACSMDRMSRFMDVEGRIALCLDKFGLDRNDDFNRMGMRNLIHYGMALVNDYEDFLYPAIREIRNSNFVEPL